ncbi:VOC family protein [Pantoea sp. FN060301]|uniref:VOC family protein n=1 Tax=Pantoea sp. FN060301 TaxID=3420380 RepID=UPI003D169078
MKISRIDHVHVYVDDVAQAEDWYREILGFSREVSLYFWFEQGGPLVIKNNDASLSLFRRNGQAPGHTIAFHVGASAFNNLLPLLANRQIAFTVCDHEVSMSVYFSDLSGNKIEVTSYEYSQARQIIMGAEAMR